MKLVKNLATKCCLVFHCIVFRCKLVLSQPFQVCVGAQVGFVFRAKTVRAAPPTGTVHSLAPN